MTITIAPVIDKAGFRVEAGETDILVHTPLGYTAVTPAQARLIAVDLVRAADTVEPPDDR